MTPTKLPVNNANCYQCLYQKACKVFLRPPVYYCGNYKENWNITKKTDATN